MVYRVFVEKKEGLANEAESLLSEARNLLGIRRLEKVRLFNRYDAENISAELFRSCVKTVFSEPQLDVASETIPWRPFPASLTSGRTPPPSASRSSPRESAPWCAPPRSTPSTAS